MSDPIVFRPLLAGQPDLAGHHRHLLEDRVRTRAMCGAVSEAVRPGDVVADLGTGTGILAVTAVRAGARRVYAIERSPVIEAARRIAAANRVDDRIVFLPGHSRDVDVPEPLDVLVSECFGIMAIGGTMLQALTRLRERVLRPGGRVVPERVAVWIAPVQAPRFEDYLSFWDGELAGVDVSSARHWPRNNLYNVDARGVELLAPPARIASIDLRTETVDGACRADIELAATRDGTLHGWVGWFTSQLTADRVLDTSPDAPLTVWRQVFFPLLEPLPIRAGSGVSLRFATEPSPEPSHCLHFHWTTSIGGHTMSQSTRQSWPDA